MGCSFCSKDKGNAPKIFTIVPSRFVRENNKTFSEVYLLGNFIGEGTHGKVHTCTHRITGQNRAVKIILKCTIKGTKTRFRFVNEISILKDLDHPNIIKLHEFFEDERSYYVVTDLVSGCELIEFIIKEKNLNEIHARTYMKQILETLSYLHSKNIVHRDIKLENIMIEKIDSVDVIKVIDFGTSVVRKNKTMKRRRGTTAYIAPEVYQNKYDAKCDLWSSGVIMYIILSGLMPFIGITDKDMIDNIIKGAYSVTSGIWKHISPEALDLLSHLLNPNPSSRYSASQALSHPWFRSESSQTISDRENTKIIENLRNFRAEFKMQKAVLCYISNELVNEVEKIELVQVFKNLDTENTGLVNREKLSEACKRFWGERKSDVEKMFKEIDIDRNGVIDYTEFLVAALNKEKMLSSERLEATFKVFDRDGSGKITADEIKEMLENYDVENSAWDKIVEEVDSNGDGAIDLREFKDMMMRLNR